MSNLWVDTSDLTITLEAFSAKRGDNRILTMLYPGGTERMGRLMEVCASAVLT
ncbi:hypothetical protein J2046_005563 [Rhizobium petrolearium]|uniref:Uncharacterized protein n=2 Tax=Neorhizobium TaxID=1525371 RepID=A0ABV0MA36_9HYPH|nr:hypothetical protein [Neorhizobium petrolearium]MBP1847279.1 hypothetical protein [Neorhizobium petrolearium]MCC2614320.1 hypothetical protein [Neorhizobium petrolearium]WGI72422.1 hypothetical protein QEO92_31435 [Neorhizobium petrolearium]